MELIACPAFSRPALSVNKFSTKLVQEQVRLQPTLDRAQYFRWTKCCRQSEPCSWTADSRCCVGQWEFGCTVPDWFPMPHVTEDDRRWNQPEHRSVKQLGASSCRQFDTGTAVLKITRWRTVKYHSILRWNVARSGVWFGSDDERPRPNEQPHFVPALNGSGSEVRSEP